jgi:hypothetical protein
MSWRSQLEDRYTVICESCKTVLVCPERKLGQRYLLDTPCPHCGHIRPRTS